MRQYHELMERVYTHGLDGEDRTGVGTRSIFGHQMRFDLSNNRLPMVTGKFTSFKNVLTELLWFLRGECDRPGAIKFLHKQGCHIWDEWAFEDGSFGPIYGVQWKFWRSYDKAGHMSFVNQLEQVVQGIKTNPRSRRHIVSAWNPGEVSTMALPPCHVMFQFYASPEGLLSCQLYQRSADVFLGVPYNIASYSLLTHMVAQVTGYEAHEFIWTGGDCHLYHNHFDQVREYLRRPHYDTPYIKINPAIKSLDAFTMEDFELIGYESGSHIKAEIAV